MLNVSPPKRKRPVKDPDENLTAKRIAEMPDKKFFGLRTVRINFDPEIKDVQVIRAAGNTRPRARQVHIERMLGMFIRHGGYDRKRGGLIQYYQEVDEETCKVTRQITNGWHRVLIGSDFKTTFKDTDFLKVDKPSSDWALEEENEEEDLARRHLDQAEIKKMLGLEVDAAAEEVIRRQQEAKSKRTRGLKKGSVSPVPDHGRGRGKHDTHATDVARERNLAVGAVEAGVTVLKSDNPELRQQLQSGTESPKKLAKRARPRRRLRESAYERSEISGYNNYRFYWEAESLISKVTETLNNRWTEKLENLTKQVPLATHLPRNDINALIEHMDSRIAGYLNVRTALEDLKAALYPTVCDQGEEDAGQS